MNIIPPEGTWVIATAKGNEKGVFGQILKIESNVIYERKEARPQPRCLVSSSGISTGTGWFDLFELELIGGGECDTE